MEKVKVVTLWFWPISGSTDCRSSIYDETEKAYSMVQFFSCGSTLLRSLSPFRGNPALPVLSEFTIQNSLFLSL